MNNRIKQAYMDVATRFSELSYAKRLKVGCIIVKDNRIISIGYNGTPAGWDNQCEYRVWRKDENPLWENLPLYEIEDTWPYVEYSDIDDQEIDRYRLATKLEVLHAERNALDKLANSHDSGKHAHMFVTHTPCIECSKSIYGAGIEKVYFKHKYRSLDGVDFLRKCNIGVEQIV